MKNKTSILVFFAFLMACSTRPASDRLEDALQFAGDNRPELEKVLAQYADDSLKLAAAEFLIENMPHYYTRTQQGKIYDSKTVGADFLIRNIDQAFDVWQSHKWALPVTFDDFCEQILPYRIKDEPLSDWRQAYREQLQPALDSLLTNSRDPLEAAGIIKQALESRDWEYVETKPTGYLLPDALTLLNDQRSGDCYECAYLAVYAMRATGIAGGIESYLQHPFDTGHHLWNFVQDTLGNTWEFSMYAYAPRPAKREKPIMGRVFRQCFGVQAESLPIVRRDNSDLPPLLNNAFIRDVSAHYLPDVSIDIKANRFTKKDDILYLCTFAPNGWAPIAWTKWQGGKFTFDHIEKNMLYLPAYYKEGKIVAADHPFMINQYGIFFEFKADKKHCKSLTVSRKYPRRSSWDSYSQRIKGGKFQLAADSTFAQAITVQTVTQASDMLWHTITLPQAPVFRYFRYLSGKNGNCNMAEIQVFDNTGMPVAGKIIGTEGSYQNKDNNNRSAVFDGDPLTFFDAIEANGAWAGLDFGSPQSVREIRYIFRNDDNNVRIGDDYELFYWDKQWQPLGKKTADSGELHYDNVPDGALLLLHNYTRGKEERPFVMVGGEQCFISD